MYCTEKGPHDLPKAKIVGFLKEVGKSGHAFCSKSTSNDHETIADSIVPLSSGLQSHSETRRRQHSDWVNVNEPHTSVYNAEFCLYSMYIGPFVVSTCVQQ